MNLLRRMFQRKEPAKLPQEWIAVYFKLSDGAYGTEEERDAVHKFSTSLDRLIKESGTGTFDGDEFGNGEGGLFMYGPNADALFSSIEPLLRSWTPLKGGYAIKRYGIASGESERVPL